MAGKEQVTDEMTSSMSICIEPELSRCGEEPDFQMEACSPQTSSSGGGDVYLELSGDDVSKEPMASPHGFGSHQVLSPCFMELAQDFSGWIAFPLQELLQDLVDTTTDVMRQSHNSFCVTGETIMLIAEDVIQQSHKSCCVTREAIMQIAEDALDIKDERQLVAPLVMVLSISVNYTLPGVMLSGFSLTTKGAYLLMSMGMLVGANSMWNRWPEHADRSVQRRAAGVLLATSAYYGVLSFTGLPVALEAYVARPDIVAHGILDLVVQPFLIVNLGYLRGQTPMQMLPAICAASLGTTACTLAAATHVVNRSIVLIGIGALSLQKAHAEIVPLATGNAVDVSSTNVARAQVSADLLAFSWLSLPVAEAVGFIAGSSTETLLAVMGVIDMFQKAGVSHLVLKSEAALKLSANFLRTRSFPSEETPAASPTHRRGSSPD